ncbi:MAG: hypothetical protein ACOYUZ_04905 [Patescibacteria group bacterium]
MKKLIAFTAVIFLTAAGCAQEPPQPAPVIGQAEPIVSDVEAAAFIDEPIEVKTMAMPCLLFTNNDGFLRWVDAYGLGENEQALLMATRQSLPKEADPELIKALVVSHPEGATYSNICVIHKQAQMISWAVEFVSSTTIYSYRGGKQTSLNVQSHALEKDQFCQPRIITNTKLQWVCKDPNEKNWRQVHVQRKTGQMEVLDCIAEKDGKEVRPGIGCLTLAPGI